MVSRFSTSCGSAPGRATKMSTIGTTICGSSSRGVREHREEAQDQRAETTISGVSFDSMKNRAILPAGPMPGFMSTGSTRPCRRPGLRRWRDDEASRPRPGPRAPPCTSVLLCAAQPEPAQPRPVMSRPPRTVRSAGHVAPRPTRGRARRWRVPRSKPGPGEHPRSSTGRRRCASTKLDHKGAAGAGHPPG